MKGRGLGGGSGTLGISPSQNSAFSRKSFKNESEIKTLPEKSKRIHHWQNCTTRNVKGCALEERELQADGNVGLHGGMETIMVNKWVNVKRLFFHDLL